MKSLVFIIPSCTVIPHLTTTFGLVPNANLTTDFFPELKVYECWAGYEWTINSYVWKKFKMKFFSFSLDLFCTRSITKIGESVCNKEQKIWRKTSKKENEIACAKWMNEINEQLKWYQKNLCRSFWNIEEKPSNE